MRKCLITPWLAAAILLPIAPAQACESSPPGRDVVVARVVTMNNRGVASYSNVRLDYRPPIAIGTTRLPAHWETAPGLGRQHFSDRSDPTSIGGYRHIQFSPFRADAIDLKIFPGAPVIVQLTLRSWGNANLTFSGYCSANGVIHGTARESDILIYMVRGPGG